MMSSVKKTNQDVLNARKSEFLLQKLDNYCKTMQFQILFLDYMDFPEQSTSQIVLKWVSFEFRIVDLKKLKESLVNNKADIPGLCSKLKSEYCQQLKVNKSFQRSEESQQDFLAQSLVPPDVPPNLIAHRIVGGRNCLYHAISVSLVGSMEHSTILRMLIAIELFENAHYYANHPRFREALQSGCPFGDVTVFTLALKESGIAEWERSINRVSAI